MASGALFGSSTRAQSKNLVEFKAGKMYMKGNTVHPDKRRGFLYIHQTDDSLIHLCWKDRNKGTVEDDLIIFPDDCQFKQIPAPVEGRIFVLKFKSSNKKMIYWMQEPHIDGDEELCKKVNDSLNNPPAVSARGSNLADLSALGGESDIHSLLGNMSQQQLMQILGGGIPGLSTLLGGRPSSTQSESSPPSRIQSSPGSRPAQASEANTPIPPRPVTAAAGLPSQSTTPGGIQLVDLQNILSGLGEYENPVPAHARSPHVDLSAAITPEMMIPILSNAQVQERLIPYLPDGEEIPKTAAELRATIATPQFHQALQSFSAALSTGQLGPLMHQFGLGNDVVNAATAGDVEAFIRAMQEAERRKKDSKK